MAFAPTSFVSRVPTARMGYLDDLTKDITPTDASKVADPVRDSHDYNKMDKEDVDRYGPGNLNSFVDFNEFDGGDGQMGVAGDGDSGTLEKIGDDSQETVINTSRANSKVATVGQTKVDNRSRARSARVAWGTSTGYAEKLREKGVDTARAQQLENWQNQNELNRKRKTHRYETDEFDSVNLEERADEDWRTLKKFGVERNQDFDLEEAFGPVVVGDNIMGTLELKASPGRLAYQALKVSNDYMGFADFRAAFTGDTSMAFEVEPTEGSINKSEETEFIVRFKPDGPGVTEGFLVIETEDFKKTWKLIGSTS